MYSIPGRKESEQRHKSGSIETIFCRLSMLVFASKESGRRKEKKRLVLTGHSLHLKSSFWGRELTIEGDTEVYYESAILDDEWKPPEIF